MILAPAFEDSGTGHSLRARQNSSVPRLKRYVRTPLIEGTGRITGHTPVRPGALLPTDCNDLHISFFVTIIPGDYIKLVFYITLQMI